MTMNATPIQLTARTPLSSIVGVVYAKPNVTTNPPGCMFYPQSGTPDSIGDIYDTAASELPGGQQASHKNWPGGVTQTNLDINFGAMGFTTAGTYVAIAFNLDTAVNGETYDYSFASASTTSFVPTVAIEEEDTQGTLTWITGDTFQDGVVTGPTGEPEGKTVVIVCPVVAYPPQSFVPYNMSIVAVLVSDPTNTTATTIDPKIKNDNQP